MGYTTDFFGKFNLDKELSKDQYNYLVALAETRRMKRDPNKLPADPIRDKVGLPAGVDGEFFVGAEGFHGQGKDSSIIEYNKPPSTQPGLWCKWIPTKDALGIEWDGNEKFYYYVEWLEYIIVNFLDTWGYILNGEVSWSGEDPTDTGTIVVENNSVIVKKD